MSYETERDAFSRTPQYIVDLFVTSCDNLYASGNIENQCDFTEDLDNASWTKSGGTTVTANQYALPEGVSGEVSTMDKVALAAVGDYIESNSSDDNAASQTFTVSCWLRTDSGTGTVTLKILNTAATVEEGALICRLTTTPQRFNVSRTFAAGAGGKVRLRIYRDTGDLATVGAWGGCITKSAALTSYAKVPGTGTVNASNCAAADAGVGNRCWYSRVTCQDPTHFRINTGGPYAGLKRFRFCLKDAPLPLPGEDIWPMLTSVDFTAQRIDPENSVTEPERVQLVFNDDAATWIWNQDKLSVGGLVNSGTPSGTFWRRFMRIYRNYSNPRNFVTVKVGFAAAGMTESDFKQRGKYLIDNLQIDGNGVVTMELVSALRLLRTKAPAKISESNLLNGAITNVATTAIFDDLTELTPPGTGYTVTIQIADDSAFTTNTEFLNVTAVSGNTATVTRGRWGSTGVSHGNDSFWREVLMMGTERSVSSLTPIGKNPIDCALELLQRGGILAADIDTTTLTDERDTWLAGSANATTGTQSGILFKRAGITLDSGNGGISIQTDINTLLKQIRQSCLLDLWIGEDQRVTGRIFAPARPSVTLLDITETDNIIKGSLSVDDNEESRITRVVVARELRANATGESIADYQNFSVSVGNDEEAASFYGGPRTRALLCPWIRNGDDSTARRLGRRIFSRFRNSVRKIPFDLEIKDDALKCGDHVFLTSAKIQKPDGTTDSQRIMQMVRKKRVSFGRISYESLDTGLFRRYGFIAPNGTPVYQSATVQQRRYGFIGTATDNLVGTPREDGDYIWG